MEKMLIIGLGNHGKEYVNTYHNIGFMFLDVLADIKNIKFAESHNYLLASFVMPGMNVFLLKPLTFMNLSGLAVQKFLSQNEIVSENIHVVCDDLNRDLGVVKSKFEGGLGGHNGLRSITGCVGNSYWKHLIGSGRPEGLMPVSSFVLSKIPKEKVEILVQDAFYPLIEKFKF